MAPLFQKNVHQKLTVMNNYVSLVLGFLIGQFGSTAICIYFLQKKKAIDYWPAARAYVKAEIGLYIIAFAALLTVMYLLPDVINPVKDAKMSESMWNWKQKVVTYFRLYVIAFGVFAPLIALLLYRKGRNAIIRENDKIEQPYKPQ